MAAEYRKASSGAEERWKPHRERLHNRTQVHFQCSTGPRSHNAEAGYTTMSKAKGIKHSHDSTGCVCVCVWKTEKETDCECTRGSLCETPVCTVTLLLFMDTGLCDNKARVSEVSVYLVLV